MIKKIALLFILFLFFMPLKGFAAVISSPEPFDYKTGLFDDTDIIESTDVPPELRDNKLGEQKISLQPYYVNFKYPVHIKGFYYSMWGSGSAFLKVTFQSGQIAERTFNDTGENYIDLNYENVTRIEMINSSNYAKYFKEFEFFGSYENPSTESILPVSELDSKASHDRVNLSWTNPKQESFEGVTIKQDGNGVVSLGKNVSSHEITGLEPQKTYKFEVVANYSNGKTAPPIEISVTTEKEPIVENSPDDITHLNWTAKQTIVSFRYTLPVSSDFSHLLIYRDNVQIADNHKEDTFMDSGLIPNKSFTYKFISVDIYGNVSPGYIVTVHTEPEVDNVPPSPPTGLNVVNGNESLRLTWKKNTEDDLKGYNIYLNGVQINDSLVYSNYYVIPNLNNGDKYSLQVSAVDTSGNESALSESVTGIPTVDGIPVFESKYDLSDVSLGVSNWFSALWLILAFSVGIPLAFYISSRIKALFFS